jgi:hypothetical protein
MTTSPVFLFDTLCWGSWFELKLGVPSFPMIKGIMSQMDILKHCNDKWYFCTCADSFYNFLFLC